MYQEHGVRITDDNGDVWTRQEDGSWLHPGGMAVENWFNVHDFGPYQSSTLKIEVLKRGKIEVHTCGRSFSREVKVSPGFPTLGPPHGVRVRGQSGWWLSRAAKEANADGSFV